jgi:hypothetical protein
LGTQKFQASNSSRPARRAARNSASKYTTVNAPNAADTIEIRGGDHRGPWSGGRRRPRRYPTAAATAATTTPVPITIARPMRNPTVSSQTHVIPSDAIPSKYATPERRTRSPQLPKPRAANNTTTPTARNQAFRATSPRIA